MKYCGTKSYTTPNNSEKITHLMALFKLLVFEFIDSQWMQESLVTDDLSIFMLRKPRTHSENNWTTEKTLN